MQCTAGTALFDKSRSTSPQPLIHSPRHFTSSLSERVIMVGYGQMHKQTWRKEWAAFYVDYDLLQRMLQNFIDFPGD
jgi:hypothetical protein